MSDLKNNLYLVLDLLRDDVQEVMSKPPSSYWGDTLYGPLTKRDRLHCADGFSVSVQMSYFNYCNPREALTRSDQYTEAELGYPSQEEPLITEYAEDRQDLSRTVYGYVPMQVVEQVFQKHGGLHPAEVIRLTKLQKQLQKEQV